MEGKDVTTQRAVFFLRGSLTSFGIKGEELSRAKDIGSFVESTVEEGR